MSTFDKDSKSKVSKPSDKKFLSGFLDGFSDREKFMAALILSKKIRRGK